MIAYKNEKLNNAIAYLVIQHKKYTKKFPSQTDIFKYLSFVEFESIEKTGHPVFELEYKAMERGPVPIDLYRNKPETEYFKFAEENTAHYKKVSVISKKKPSLEYFSPFEIDLLEKTIEIFARSYITSNQRSDASHEKIRAWQVAWQKKHNSMIDYKDTFERDISLEDEENLSDAELHYKNYTLLT